MQQDSKHLYGISLVWAIKTVNNGIKIYTSLFPATRKQNLKPFQKSEKSDKKELL